MPTLRKLFGSNLRQSRKARGLTLQMLAEKAELSIETIGRIERGQTSPSFDTAELLARVLAVPPQELFGLQGHMDPASVRGTALLQLQAILAEATDDQIGLIAEIAQVLVARKSSL